MPNFIKRIWNGEVELGIIYWFYFVLLGAILQITFLLLLNTDFGFNNMTELGIIECAVLIPFYTLIDVGVWRSATEYAKLNAFSAAKRGNRIWATLAKIVVVLNVFQLIKLFLSLFFFSASQIQTSIDTLNKALPRNIDSETRLDKVTYDGNVVYYNYALIKYENSEAIKGILDNTKSVSVKETCADKNLVTILNADKKIAFVYRDKNNSMITTVFVTKTDCN